MIYLTYIVHKPIKYISLVYIKSIIEEIIYKSKHSTLYTVRYFTYIFRDYVEMDYILRDLYNINRKI